MDATPVIKVTKLDAARRQLRTAIELWFAGGDPVSIHALAYAAHEIIHRLFRQKGLSDLFFDSSLIKPEYSKEFSLVIKESANFFKHAKRDNELNQTRTFHLSANDLYLTMSVAGLLRMGETLQDAELAFNFWNVIHNPHWYPEQIRKHGIPVADLSVWQSLEKPEFFRRVVSLKALHDGK